MLQIFAASTFLVLAAGGFTLIAAMLAEDSHAIAGALRGMPKRAPVRAERQPRVRLVSMPATAARLRTQRRACA